MLDPFGGVGGVHALRERDDRWLTYAVEIEKEWAFVSTFRGNTTCMDFFEFDRDAMFTRILRDGTSMDDWKFYPAPERFDAVVTSPCYGNRMADHHNAQDGSRRRSYKHDLGRELTPGSSAGMQWGREYRNFHRRAWLRVFQLLDDFGLFVLNVSDHVRRGELVEVARWHDQWIMKNCMCERVDAEVVGTPRLRYGENREARAEGEMVYAYRKVPF